MQTLGDVITAGLILAALIVVPWKIARAWLWPYAVKRYQNTMSSAAVSEDRSRPSSLETDAGRTPDGRTPAPIEAKQLLTLYRLMRAYGVKRDEAQAACAASGLPFNNNVWSLAKPDDPPHLTPVANRPTDADFPYQPADY